MNEYKNDIKDEIKSIQNEKIRLLELEKKLKTILETMGKEKWGPYRSSIPLTENQKEIINRHYFDLKDKKGNKLQLYTLWCRCCREFVNYHCITNHIRNKKHLEEREIYIKELEIEKWEKEYKKIEDTYDEWEKEKDD